MATFQHAVKSGKNCLGFRAARGWSTPLLQSSTPHAALASACCCTHSSTEEC